MSDNFLFTIRPGWADITADLDFDDAPVTFAKSDGVGAFQISAAIYKGGQMPDPTCNDLLSIISEGAESMSLGEPTEIVTEEAPLRLAAANFHSGDHFVRIWQVSDGWSIAKLTYTCAHSLENDELHDCECMVRTFRFLNTNEV